MSKKRWNVIVMASGGILAAAFLTLLFLSLPFGVKGSVISPLVFCIAGSVIAGVFLAAAVFFFVRTRKRG